MTNFVLLLNSRRRRNRSASPPIPEEERDKRTVFVTQLSVRLESRELEEFFSQAGKVRDAKIIMDRNSRRSKGYYKLPFEYAFILHPTDCTSFQYCLIAPESGMSSFMKKLPFRTHWQCQVKNF
jgi:hypothetical protein